MRPFYLGGHLSFRRMGLAGSRAGVPCGSSCLLPFGKHEYGFHPLAGADPPHLRLRPRFHDPAFVVPSKRKETTR